MRFIRKVIHIKKISLNNREETRTRVGDFPGGPVAKTPGSQCRGPRFNPWLGNWIPHATTKSLHPTAKDPACCNKDQRSQVLQLRPNAAKCV